MSWGILALWMPGIDCFSSSKFTFKCRGDWEECKNSVSLASGIKGKNHASGGWSCPLRMSGEASCCKAPEEGKQSSVLANLHCVQQNLKDVSLTLRIAWLASFEVVYKWWFWWWPLLYYPVNIPPPLNPNTCISCPLQTLSPSRCRLGMLRLLSDPFPAGLLEVQTSSEIDTWVILFKMWSFRKNCPCYV